MTKRSFLVLAALLVAPLARSDDERSEISEIVGYRIYVSKPGPVHVILAELPGQIFRDVDGSVLTTYDRRLPVGLVADDDHRGFVFWGEQDFTTRDARGRCYHLHAPTKPAEAREKAPSEVLNEEGASSTVGLSILPEEKRSYHALEKLDLGSLQPAKNEKERDWDFDFLGGNWFYDQTLTFDCPDKGTARLELDGVYVVRAHRMAVPGGFSDETGLMASDDLGTLTATIDGSERSDDIARHREVHLYLPVSKGKNKVQLSSDLGGVPLVQRARLVLEQTVRPGFEFEALGSVQVRPYEVVVRVPPFEGVLLNLDKGTIIDVHSGTNALLVNLPKATKCAVVDPRNASRPERVECCFKHPPILPADWVAVGPRALLAAVEPLAKHRRGQGLTTELVALEDILDDEEDGTLALFSIEEMATGRLHSKEFERLAGSRFILLVGDAARDGRPDDGGWLPTQLVDTYVNGATATDRNFGHCVGRFPCRTKEDVAAMVAKTIAYEKCPAGDWQRELSFVLGEGRFGSTVDGLIEQVFTQAVGERVPASYDIDVTYANPRSVYFFPPDGFAEHVVDRLSQGPLIFDYVGHGTPENLDTVHWGKKRFPILTAKDARKVHCPEGRYPVALLTASWAGAFDEPEETVAKALALNPHGPVAVLAASRVSHPFTNALLSLELTRRIFEQNDERLGTRVREALDELSLKSGGAEGKLVVKLASSQLAENGLAERLIEDERHLYNLLGDPALVLRLPRPISVEAPAEARAGTSVRVSVEKGTLRAVALGRERAPRKDLAGLDPATGPEAMADPEVENRVRETYAKANDLVVVRGSVAEAGGVLDLPKDLAPGSYIIKVVTAAGEAGAARLCVRPPKKYY